MKVSVLFVLLTLGTPATSIAQHATVTKHTTPLAGEVDFSKIDDKYNAQVFSLEAPKPDAESEQAKLRATKAEVSKRFPRQRLTGKHKTTTATPPALVFSYVADTFPGVPPDNDLAVSKNNVSVSVINSWVAVHNGNTGQMTYQKRTLRGFSNSVGLPNGISVNRYDPKIIYDQDADRFIAVLLHERDESNWIIVGFSTTNNPGGTWKFYKFYGNSTGDTTWFDYPSISITPKEFFLTGNKIRFQESWQQGFKETVVYQIDKQAGYNGDTALTYNLWQNISFNGKNIRNLYPVKAGSYLQGPEQYFLSNRNFDIQNDTVFLVKIPDTIGGSTNLTVVPLKSNIPYGVPPNGLQPDTSLVLATNDGRVLGAFREGNEIQFVSTTVHPVSGSSAVYHGRIANYATAPTLSADYYVVDTLDFGYPNLSYAGNNGAQKASIISFNYTGKHSYPGFAAIGYDGAQYSDMVYIKTGSNYIAQLNDTVQRWGDYSGSQPDHNAHGTVWVEGIYGRQDKEYGNYIGKLVSPFVNKVSPTQTLAGSSRLYPNPVSQIVQLQFEIPSEAVVRFVITDVQGRIVDQVLSHRCKAGKNKIQFDVVTLSPGIYFLKGVDDKGGEVMSQRFVKQ
jgi:hypothetical protein